MQEANGTLARRLNHSYINILNWKRKYLRYLLDIFSSLSRPQPHSHERWQQRNKRCRGQDEKKGVGGSHCSSSVKDRAV